MVDPVKQLLNNPQGLMQGIEIEDSLLQGSAPPVDAPGPTIANAAKLVKTPPQSNDNAPSTDDNFDQLQAQRQAQAKEIMALPEVQELLKKSFSEEPAPTAPNPEYRSSLDVFKDLAPALAVLGGSFTKAPLMGAMAAATGAMQGFNQGDKNRVELEMAKWKDHMEEWKLKHEQFKEVREKIVDKDGNINYPALELYANATGNPNLTALLAQDLIKAAEAHMDFSEKELKLKESLANIEKIHALTEAAKNTANTALSDGVIAQKGKAIVNGASYSSVGLSMRANKNPDKNAVDEWIAENYPDFRPDEAQIDFAGRKAGTTSAARTAATKGTTIELASNMLNNSLPILRDAFAKVDNSQFTDLNSFENYFKSHTNDPNLAALRESILTTESDLALLIRRGGAATVDSATRAEKVVNDLMNTKSFDAFERQVLKEAAAAREAELKTRNDISGKKEQPSQEDLEYTAKTHNMTVDEVKKKLGL